MNSGQGGDQAISLNINSRLSGEKSDIDCNREILDDGKDIKIYHRRKRLKNADHSEFSRADVESFSEGADSSSGDIGQSMDTSSLFQHVEFESALPCTSSSMGVNRVTFEDGISAEVDEKSLDKSSHCSVEFQETSLNEYDRRLIGKSDDTIADAGMHALMLLESSAGNGEIFNVEPMETNSDEFPGVTSSGACCDDIPTHLGMNEQCLSKHAAAERNCVNANMVVSDHLEEQHDEAKDNVADGEALGAITPLYHEEQQCVPSYADLSLELLDGTQDVLPQVVHESMNVDADRAFDSYKQKKLLVLDLNGLLVDISSVVPYNFEPDDIIMKKAVFRRPHCDDFLNFCFERFNVGFWTSRTKRNMEPILDFLLGNSKSRLLFYWDQSHCTETGFYTVEKRDKPLLLKKLKKLWDKREPGLPWDKGVYNESNTLLVDDTPSKALSNPRYTAIFPYSYRYRNVRDNSLGPGGDLRVYLEGLAEADNVQEYVKQNPFGQRPITEKNLSWGYYRKVIEANSTPPRETDTNNPR